MEVILKGTKSEVDKTMEDIFHMNHSSCCCLFDVSSQCKKGKTDCHNCSIITKVITRWRAKEGERYYYVKTSPPSTVIVDFEHDHNFTRDNFNFENGNYFKTKEQATKVADKIKHIFNTEEAE